MTLMKAPRAAPWVFLIALVPGLALTSAVYLSAVRQAADEFDRVAELAVDRVVSLVGQHVVALQASRGLWDAQNGVVSRDEFVRFLRSFDLANQLSGVRGIGFAPMIVPAEMTEVASAITESYGVAARPTEPTDQPWRTPVLLSEGVGPTTMSALGYDMYSDPTRRAAMDAAIANSAPQATGPVQLVGTEPQSRATGFLIFLPLAAPDTASASSGAPVPGFVFSAFRGQDLIDAALASGLQLPVTMDVVDAGDPSSPLRLGANSRDWPMRQLEASILGRTWTFTLHPTGRLMIARWRAETVFLGLLSVVFALAMAYAVASRQDEAARARQLAATSAREAEHRDLLVQEMKHRIKNYIARIQSIARQSARGATDVETFIQTFDARLRAMAVVQEVLAGTVVPQVDLRAILQRELQQALDTSEAEHLLDGPHVLLNERQAHAFGLVAHELLTNALKHGGLSPQGEGLRVAWSVMRGRLTVIWQETFAVSAGSQPNESGFGSRLIDASLKGELSGTLTRRFREGGLEITLVIPISDQNEAKAQKERPAPV
jgi:CHASE1-domain containing sensor protein/two-component sensor histidine kinase